MDFCGLLFTPTGKGNNLLKIALNILLLLTKMYAQLKPNPRCARVALRPGARTCPSRLFFRLPSRHNPTTGGRNVSGIFCETFKLIRPMQAVKFVFFVCVNSLKMATSCCESTQRSAVAAPTLPTDVGRPPNYSYTTPGPLRYSGYATCLLCERLAAASTLGWTTLLHTQGHLGPTMLSHCDIVLSKNALRVTVDTRRL